MVTKEHFIHKLFIQDFVFVYKMFIRSFNFSIKCPKCDSLITSSNTTIDEKRGLELCKVCNAVIGSTE